MSYSISLNFQDIQAAAILCCITSGIHFCQIDVNFCQTDVNFSTHVWLKRKVNVSHLIRAFSVSIRRTVQSQNRSAFIFDCNFETQKTQIKGITELPEDYQHSEHYPVGKAKMFTTSNTFLLMHAIFKVILKLQIS